jgi:hypothetical protein
MASTFTEERRQDTHEDSPVEIVEIRPHERLEGSMSNPGAFGSTKDATEEQGTNDPIPVILLSGFLGAGKTTLRKHIT